MRSRWPFVVLGPRYLPGSDAKGPGACAKHFCWPCGLASAKPKGPPPSTDDGRPFDFLQYRDFPIGAFNRRFRQIGTFIMKGFNMDGLQWMLSADFLYSRSSV